MNLTEYVEQIIKENFSFGDYFDSHTIINLIVLDSKAHLAYMNAFSNKNCNIAQFHGFIAKNIIAKAPLVKSVSDSAISLNIYGVTSKNELWQIIVNSEN